MDELKIYTLEEVQDVLKVGRRTLYNYIKGGKLYAVKVGKSWRVSHEALRDFIASGTSQAS